MTEPDPRNDPLLRATRRLLRPLVRLWMRRGVTFPVITALLRELFVDVARNDLLDDEKSRTDSRIAVLSGVHRKELRRLRTLPAEEHGPPPRLALGALIVARWLGVPPYAGPPGQPRPLPRAAEPPAPSFESLVAEITRDVRPRAVLDELVAQEVVQISADGMVRLRDAAYIPAPEQDEQLWYFARNLHDHAAAAAANILAGPGGQAPFLDRSVHYDRLTPEAAAALQGAAREAAIRTLLEINALALRLGATPAPPGGAAQRVNLGIFLYREDERPAPTDGDAP